MFHLLKPGPGKFIIACTKPVPAFDCTQPNLYSLSFLAVVKTEKTGSDNLLASHGLSKIYQFLLARGHDMYLKGLPESVKLYKYAFYFAASICDRALSISGPCACAELRCFCCRGTESCALAPLCTLNPFGIAFEPLKPKAIASFNLQKSSCAPLPQVSGLACSHAKLPLQQDLHVLPLYTYWPTIVLATASMVA